MGSFGEFLRRERELRGVTLEEISKTSNISVSYLKALESDDLDNLPADVFVKGFLRCYADSIGMDHDEVLLGYRSFSSSKREEYSAAAELIETPKTFNFKLSTFFAIVIFIAISSLMVFYFVKKSKEMKPDTISEKMTIQKLGTEKIDEESKKNIGVLIDLKPESEKTSDKITDDQVSETIPVEKKLTLTMEATEDAWIGLVLDDSEADEALLLTGEKASWKANERFFVNLGNVTGTRLTLNGKNITLPQKSNNTLKNYEITLDSIKPE